MTIPTLLTPSYWFSTNPTPFVPFMDRFLLVLSIALVVVGLVGLVYALRSGMEKLMRRAVMHAAWVKVWAGLVGLLLYAFMFERIPVLSMRIFWVLWGAWLVWEAYRTWKRVTVEIPKENARRNERAEKEKWLPKKRT